MADVLRMKASVGNIKKGTIIVLLAYNWKTDSCIIIIDRVTPVKMRWTDLVGSIEYIV